MAKGAAAVWEVRPPAVGSDTNGGGYDSIISGAGTDYSLQNAAQVSVTDAVTNGTTTVTSATAGFTSAMVGNACYLSGGTGSVAADRYFVTGFTNSTTITVDRSTGLYQRHGRYPQAGRRPGLPGRGVLGEGSGGQQYRLVQGHGD
jgi:hypothetical protein